MNVGIFFKVANDFLIDSVPIEESEPYGDALQYGGHYDFHESLHFAVPLEHRFKAHDYDYYPRGRVVYFPERNEFTLYADPCLTPDDISRIIDLFGLDGQAVEVSADEHYRCSMCNRLFGVGKVTVCPRFNLANLPVFGLALLEKLGEMLNACPTLPRLARISPT